jgi:UDP-N-acetylmuramate dehydrogenase
VATQGRLDGLERVGEHGVRAEAGVACAKVARFAARAGLCGVEFLAGIPGTLGGALAMNAGAFGSETWERVVGVETVDRAGRIRQRGREAFQIAYRETKGPEGEWFLGARLELEAGDASAAQARIRDLLERRSATQPTSQPSCGSVFRNPQGDHAARLIEAAGLKGQCVGGACVSEKHANFIVNTHQATAADIETLINLVRDRVERTSGVQLTAEVHIVGEAG